MDDLVEFFVELVFEVLLASCEESARARRFWRIVAVILFLASLIFAVFLIMDRGVTGMLVLPVLVAISCIIIFLFTVK